MCPEDGTLAPTEASMLAQEVGAFAGAFAGETEATYEVVERAPEAVPLPDSAESWE